MVGKYLSVLGGIVAVAVGIFSLMSWWDEVTIVSKAVLVVILIFGGLLAFFAGAGEIKDSAAEKQKEEKK
jgi:hypothetical protein